jgi:two-component system, NtrC family, sensor kinase
MNFVSQSERLQTLQERLAVTERALEKSERLALAGRFGAEMAHEINNPLEAIVNLIYLARIQTLPDEAQICLDTVDEQIKRVLVISKQILDFHRTVDHPSKVNLVNLMEIALRTLKPRIAEKNMRLELDLPDNIQCTAFPGELTQVFSNLIANSIEASVPDDRLIIRIRAGCGRVVVSVRDFGSGIPSSLRSVLFDAFVTGKESGNGLGLWICRRIVAKHGGNILWRSSTNPDRHGTVFRISLIC